MELNCSLIFFSFFLLLANIWRLWIDTKCKSILLSQQVSRYCFGNEEPDSCWEPLPRPQSFSDTTNSPWSVCLGGTLRIYAQKICSAFRKTVFLYFSLKGISKSSSFFALCERENINIVNIVNLGAISLRAMWQKNPSSLSPLCDVIYIYNHSLPCVVGEENFTFLKQEPTAATFPFYRNVLFCLSGISCWSWC